MSLSTTKYASYHPLGRHSMAKVAGWCFLPVWIYFTPTSKDDSKTSISSTFPKNVLWLFGAVWFAIFCHGEVTRFINSQIDFPSYLLEAIVLFGAALFGRLTGRCLCWVALSSLVAHWLIFNECVSIRRGQSDSHRMASQLGYPSMLIIWSDLDLMLSSIPIDVG